MTFEEMMSTIETTLEADASWWVEEGEEEGTVIHLTLEDFAGFDENWNEVERELTAPEAVETFLAMLEAQCQLKVGDFYKDYCFEGFEIIVGYASYDI
jgi:hypothetical protein